MRTYKKYHFLVYCILFATILLLASCDWWAGMWGNHRLGNHLSLWEGDKKEDRVIAYCTSESGGACVSGIYIIPSYEKRYTGEYVEEATSNKKWVIVKTIRKKEAKTNYWIISKDFNIENVDCSKVNCDSILQSYVTGPLNLSEFENKKRTFNIGLNFK